MTIKRVLITGISGMVGSHLADFIFENTNWEIYGLIRWRSPLENLQNLMSKEDFESRVKFVYGDLNDVVSIQNIVEESKPDFVFHLAAQSYPQTSFTSGRLTLDTNINGTYSLLNSLKDFSKKAKIHVCSSSEVFGRVPKEFIPINESTPFHPASPYAISKVGTDLVAKYFSEAYSMNISITRMFTHTGPRRGDVFAESTFAKQIAMIEAGYQKPVIKTGNLNSLRTWSDVRDAVRAYFMLLTMNPIPGETYNIGGNYTCTVGEMLNYLLSLSSVKNITIELEKSRLRPIDADLQIPDTSKFKEKTGWEPIIPFEKTMLDLLDFWRDKIKVSGPIVNR